jgi:hypothetical protein
MYKIAMRTYLETQIANRDRRIQELETEILTLRAERGVLAEALKHVEVEVVAEHPAPPVVVVQKKPATATSFQLSDHWAKILSTVSATGRSFDAADLINAGQAIGHVLTTPNVRSQVAYYHKKKVFRRVNKGKYVLTDVGKDMIKNAKGPDAPTPGPLSEGEAGLPEKSPTGPTPVSSNSAAREPTGGSALSGLYQPSIPAGEKGG